LVLKAASEGYLDDVPLDEIHSFERAFLAHFEAEHPTVISQIDKGDDELALLDEVFDETIATFRAAWFREKEI
jgi:F0F1-type ATP synthase alpha subunit